MHWLAPLDLSPRRAQAVWLRNLKVWRRLAIPSLLGNLADPLIYLTGLGLGLGALLGQVSGVPYVAFLATGTVAFSTMNGATFEVLYSGFARMHEQRTWEAIMNAPMSLDDVMVGELVWAATKSCFAGVAILAVIATFGLTTPLHALMAVPLVMLIGLCFAALGMIATSLADGYDFFMYYFTLFVSPMAMLSGVFFPLEQLPALVRELTVWLPLVHAVALMRPILLHGEAPQFALHAGVLVAYALFGLGLARALMRRRLLR